MHIRFPMRSNCQKHRGSQQSGPRRKACQKPISARPTQLSANIDEAIAATDAKATMVLTDRIKESHCGWRRKFCRMAFAQSRTEFVAINIESNCDCAATGRTCLPAKTHICAT
jgi:hypothetical protein